MVLNVEIIRPGAARSRLEAQIFAGFHPCPNCGASLSPTVSKPADPEDGFWEVSCDCPRCGTVIRYLFEEGPGWIGGRAYTGRDADPNSRSPVMAESDAPTTLFTPDELIALRDRGAYGMDRDERLKQASPGDPTRIRLAGMQALRMLRPMLELEHLAALGRAELPADHAALRARLVAHAEEAGFDVPPPRETA